MEELRLATRGSDLALRQADTVREALETRRRAVELVEVETRGDQIRDELIRRLGRTGAFVRTLDERVLDGDADAAVHSLKDVPTEGHPDLRVVGVPERAAAGDVLVTPDGSGIDDLPAGAVVGTGSLRRRAELLARRPDLEVCPLRGNVDTRVEKLLAPSLQREHRRRLEAADGAGVPPEAPADGDGDSGENDGTAESAPADDGSGGGADEGMGDDEDESFDRTPEEWFDDLAEIERCALGREVESEFDAVVLAEAGLARSDLLGAVATERLSREEFVPAPGQGAIAVTGRDDAAGEVIRDRIDHPRTRVETTVERTVLAGVGGGCIAPIGVHAHLQGSVVHAAVRVLGADGTETVEGTRDLPVEDHAEAAAAFAEDLRDRGAADLIERARREAEEERQDG